MFYKSISIGKALQHLRVKKQHITIVVVQGFIHTKHKGEYHSLEFSNNSKGYVLILKIINSFRKEFLLQSIIFTLMILLTNKCLGVRHKNIHCDNFYRSNFNR